MNTTQLECFVEVANYLNFSKAAQQLRLSQPAVSHQINTLEDELGVKLFHRTSKSVRLTQEGYLFLRYAGEILKLSGISKARVNDLQRVAGKRLVIGCRNVPEMRLLKPALRALRVAEPETMPVLQLIPFDSMANLLNDGDIHLLFSFGNPGIPKTRYRELTRCPVMCVCSPEYPLARYQSLSVEKLQKSGRVAACRPPVCPPPLFAAQSRVVPRRAYGEVLFCANQAGLNLLVETGYAFAVAAAFPSNRTPDLCYIPMPEIEPLSFGAVYLTSTKNPQLNRFLDLLEESLQAPANDEKKETSK